MNDSKTATVRDLPRRLSAALVERGFSETAEVSPMQALAEWSTWTLGDPSWAYEIVDLYHKAVSAAERSGGKR